MAVVLRPGDHNDLVRLLQARLNRDYPLYSHLVVDGIYGPATTGVVREFQRRAGLQVDGIAGPRTLGRLGLNFDQPAPLPTNLPFFYTASGTWQTPFMGPPFDVGWRLEQMGLVRNQPVGYPAAGFLYPNPFLSYNESVALGVAELMRLILMNAGQFYLCAYSQGAEVVVRTLGLMLPGQPLAHRAGDLLKVVTFGSPCRPPGPTLLGTHRAQESRVSTRQTSSVRVHMISCSTVTCTAQPPTIRCCTWATRRSPHSSWSCRSR